MQQSLVRRTLAGISFGLLLAALAPASAQTCSLATVAGSWGATLTGTILFLAPPSGPGPVPAAAVLRFNIDTAGNVSGTEARNVGGGFANETFKGTASVNPNCTGTATVMFFESGVLVRTSVLAAVFDDLSTQIRLVQKSLTVPSGSKVPVVITVEGKKLGGD
jgi:hypothetical protein